MFRFLRRKIAQCIVLIAAVIVLKQLYPGFGAQIGRWITGLKDSRISQAVSSMVTSLSGGEGWKDAVEVFHETIQAKN